MIINILAGLGIVLLVYLVVIVIGNKIENAEIKEVRRKVRMNIPLTKEEAKIWHSKLGGL